MSTADDAWNDWLRNRPISPTQREVADHFYRRALEDAADALEETLAGWVRSMGPSEADIGTSQAIDELRGWAAGVGTKDGDDDE